MAEEHNKEEKKKNAKSFGKVILGLVVGIFVIGLFYVNGAYPDIKIGRIILTLVGVIIVGVFLSYRDKILGKLQKSEENNDKEKRLPPAKDSEYIKELSKLKVMTPEYADMIPFCDKSSGIRTVGENPTTSIYRYSARGVHTNIRYVICMNMHYPEKFQVLINPKTDPEISRWENYLAEKKDRVPDEKTIETENAITGTKQIIKEKKYNKKEEDKEKKPEGDLK